MFRPRRSFGPGPRGGPPPPRMGPRMAGPRIGPRIVPVAVPVGGRGFHGGWHGGWHGGAAWSHRPLLSVVVEPCPSDRIETQALNGAPTRAIPASIGKFWARSQKAITLEQTLTLKSAPSHVLGPETLPGPRSASSIKHIYSLSIPNQPHKLTKSIHLLGSASFSTNSRMDAVPLS
ncbi:hypothetical protein A1Q1_02660 [Trichosporon asahii var. asahii CBS 2479]|uniref:Uncharacterized protein n=1 Tax=Trichosporon asahii var. asahii (strain ATCC 90039 / CBS 2479 / JCM 2466 / KCTC 7840 / NBRC 103889/ NCYC 2677 / UAMH 7654) TaxID=1186058 RepID=J6EZS5_TRIAS|nr:hypothetical protein A1Q1_02660 [Trichosporon asahii var. asahii CBS 2479]EJT48377.1 hypothetical protein A1Q1_02660 [Trichosporon asahii var. asahii CBS 2479]